MTTSTPAPAPARATVPGLAPDVPAALAASALVRTALDAVRTNEPSAADDGAADVVHEYRIALRRARSLVADLRHALPAPLAAEAKGELRHLAELSGPARDLDVLLAFLAQTGERDPSLAAGLQPLVELLRDERARVGARLAAELGGGGAQGLQRTLERFERDGTGPPGRDAKRPIAKLVRRRLRRRLKRIERAGEKLGADGSESAYHALRIDAKKLRYLLEACGTLVPRDARAPAVASLKRLQQALGELNDTRVHADELASRAAELAGAPAATWLAVVRLVAELERRGARQRARFPKRFRTFLDGTTELAAHLRRKRSGSSRKRARA